MKKKQKEELRSKNLAELNQGAKTKEEEIMQLRMDIRTGKVKNTSLLKVKSDELAVIKTLAKEITLRETK